MSFRRFIILAIVLMFVLSIGFALKVPAVAADSHTPRLAASAQEPACNDCHDNLYYNYDLGKAYCVGPARNRCVDCHDGDPTALDKIQAHANMVAFPMLNGDDSRCQKCHPEDHAARVLRFSQMAGFRQMTAVGASDSHFTAQAVYSGAPVVQNGAGFPLSSRIALGMSAGLIFVAGMAYLWKRQR